VNRDKSEGNMVGKGGSVCVDMVTVEGGGMEGCCLDRSRCCGGCGSDQMVSLTEWKRWLWISLGSDGDF